MEEVKACKREIVGYYTKGTFNPACAVNTECEDTERNSDSFDNRFVLVYVRSP